MWKAQLLCDVCKTTAVEGRGMHTHAAITEAKRAARLGGWARQQRHPSKLIWVCGTCLLRAQYKVGDFVTYTGNIRTIEGVGLNEQRAVIVLPASDGKLAVKFTDPSTGRYHALAHWFRIDELKPYPKTTMEKE